MTTTWGCLEQEKAFVSRSEGWKSEVKVYAGLVLLQALSGASVCVSRSFQTAAGSFRHPWLSVQPCSHHLGCLLPLRCFIRTLVVGFRAHPSPGRPHTKLLKSVTSPEALTPNRVTFMDSRWTYLSGESGHHSTRFTWRQTYQWYFKNLLVH